MKIKTEYCVVTVDSRSVVLVTNLCWCLLKFWLLCQCLNCIG